MRRRYSHSLAGNPPVEEDVNPGSYIFNIADCMLVLMLDLNEVPIQSDDIIGIQVAMDANQDGEVDDTYEERGAVYYDKSTGKYYFVANQ